MSEAPSASAQLRRPVWLIGATIAGLGLAIEVAHGFSHAPLVETLLPVLSLSYEQNLPTWWATCLHFAAGVLLASIARSLPGSAPHRHRWAFLSLLFFYISFDEATEVHENLGGLFGGSGLLYFDWVVPAFFVVTFLAVLFVPFLRDLEPRRRRQFIVAATLFVSGGLMMELPLGLWTERHGSDNLVYAMIDFVEEALEIAGISLFVLALAEHREEMP